VVSFESEVMMEDLSVSREVVVSSVRVRPSVAIMSSKDSGDRW
jgi:hypothetical protein